MRASLSKFTSELLDHAHRITCDDRGRVCSSTVACASGMLIIRNAAAGVAGASGAAAAILRCLPTRHYYHARTGSSAACCTCGCSRHKTTVGSCTIQNLYDSQIGDVHWRSQLHTRINVAAHSCLSPSSSPQAAELAAALQQLGPHLANPSKNCGKGA